MSRFPSLVLTALSAYATVHLQFGIAGHWRFAADEFEIMVASLVAGGFAFGVFTGGERLVRALVSPKYLVSTSVAAVVALSLCLGLLFYAALLPRTLGAALTRDLPFVLCFAVLAVGYLVGRKIESTKFGRGSDA